VVEQLVEHRAAFGFVHSFDRKSHQPVDVERLAPGLRMRPHDRLRILLVGAQVELGAVDLARHRFIVIGVDGLAALDARFDRGRQRLVGLRSAAMA
jgi:hypothetical protein